MSPSRAPVIILALALAVPARANADPAHDAPEATARDLGEEGLRRFQAGSWQAAYEAFQKADALLHAPTLVLYMGHAQARLGNLPGAHRHYRAVLRERLGPDAPLQFRTAQDIASQELRWVDQRLGVITIAVVGAPAGRARVVVDATEVPAAELDGVGLAPGEHVIEVFVGSAPPIRQTLTVEAGQRTKVALDTSLQPQDASSNGAPPTEAREDSELPALRPTAAALAPDSSSGLPRIFVPAAALLGVGSAALLAGAATGGVSLHLANDVKSRCNSTGHCLASDRGEAATAGQLADASTGTLIAGCVVLAAGVVLEVLHMRKHAEPTPGAAQVSVSLGYGALGGAF